MASHVTVLLGTPETLVKPVSAWHTQNEFSWSEQLNVCRIVKTFIFICNLFQTSMNVVRTPAKTEVNVWIA